MTRAPGDPYFTLKKSHAFYWRPNFMFKSPTYYFQVWWFHLWFGVYKPVKHG